MSAHESNQQAAYQKISAANSWRPALIGAAIGVVASLIAAQALTAAPGSYLASRDVDTAAVVASQAPVVAANRIHYFSPVNSRTKATVASSGETPRSASSRFVIPAGGTFRAQIQTHVSSRDGHVGDPVTAATLENITTADGQIIFPAGTTVTGRVVEVRPAVETRSAAVLKVEFTRIGGYATELAMVTPDLDARARSANTAVDVGLVAGGALAGAVLGHQVNHKRGSQVGAVIGGVTGAVAAANIGANVQLKSGETATLRFAQTLAVK